MAICQRCRNGTCKVKALRAASWIGDLGNRYAAMGVVDKRTGDVFTIVKFYGHTLVARIKVVRTANGDDAGGCVDNGFESEFTACGDLTDDECTNPDSCDAGGSCLPRHETAGAACGAAIPSYENAMQYFINTYIWAEQEDIEIFYFSSFDEAWKTGDEGDVGAYWGLWDKDGNFKYK